MCTEKRDEGEEGGSLDAIDVQVFRDPVRGGHEDHSLLPEEVEESL
jgi:hypothetical protein